MRRTIAILAALSLLLATLAVAPAAAGGDDCDVEDNLNDADSIANFNFAEIYQSNFNAGTVGNVVVVTQSNDAEVEQGNAEASSEADC